MSRADQDKSMDKKEIAEEEREKMLNAENTKHTGAAPAFDLESEEQKPRKKIPIGGIKMPGFCRTKSKEPCKVWISTLASYIQQKAPFERNSCTMQLRNSQCTALACVFFLHIFVPFSRDTHTSHLYSSFKTCDRCRKRRVNRSIVPRSYLALFASAANNLPACI